MPTKDFDDRGGIVTANFWPRSWPGVVAEGFLNTTASKIDLSLGMNSLPLAINIEVLE